LPSLTSQQNAREWVRLIFQGPCAFLVRRYTGSMKNKNMRDLEKQWADKRKKEAKPAKAAPKQKSR
jgi:hypothetical protein